jgi:hypothetical protein
VPLRGAPRVPRSSNIEDVLLLKERKNVSLYGEHPPYAKGRDCGPAENTDEFATIPTFRGCSVDDPPTDAQCKAAAEIGKRLFGMSAAAVRARYGPLPQRPAFKFAGWAGATPVEQFKAIRCLLYQACEGSVPNGRLYGELNRVAGELAQRIVQDSPDYEKAPWG